MMAYESMFLSDLTKSVKFQKSTNFVPNSAETSLDSENAEIDGIEYDFGELCIDQIKGWQKMTCHKCFRIYVEPPDPVVLSMICPGCGDVIQNEGEF